ncbi:lysophospholipid acyltransferase family protein [Leptolyngbya sp. AN02str]|uniref:lysophospholipid acyltransferase family protein n=1 Tax=Leptolyngbya sp. AN02str TaxID=3423363 RepID=UPI003D31A121
MPRSTHYAYSGLLFIPQRFNRLILMAMQLALPVLLRIRLRRWLPTGIARVEVVNAEGLAKLYSQFQSGQCRFILAFRHPEVDDPLSMLYLLSRAVPQAARQHHIPLRSPIHSHFVYDRGMTIWAGKWLGWLFSRLGGIPIHRGKRIDRAGIRAVRALLLHGQFPLAIAPEGATNGHSEVVSPLEPGVAQLSFWCAEDLKKAGRTEQVYIIPIGVQYHYIHPIWPQIDRLLSRMEQDVGLSALATPPHAVEGRYQRVLRLANSLLSEMEAFYQRFYPQHVTVVPPLEDASVGAAHLDNRPVIQRLYALRDTALKVAEAYFGLNGQGTIIDRCRRLEEAGWHAIYREDLPAPLKRLPPFRRGLADWGAEEATIRLRHMRLVESFVAVTADYLEEKPTAERFAETVLLMFDVVARIRGDRIPARPRLGWRQSRVTVGDPICVSDRQPLYERDHASAKQAVTALTQDLQTALEHMISSTAPLISPDGSNIPPA